MPLLCHMQSLKTKNTHRWVRDNNGSILIRFAHRGIRYAFNPIVGGKYSDARDRLAASAIAAQIELDIKSGNFVSVDVYKPERAKVLAIDSLKSGKDSPSVLSMCWENYKEKQLETTEKTTQKTKWVAVDKIVVILEEIPFESLNATKAMELLLKTYKTSTLLCVVKYLNAALELAVKREQIKKNPLDGFKSELPKHQNLRKKSGFTDDEVFSIIEGFESDRYVPESSNFLHSYYSEFVEALFLTGLRPQMLIALRWRDIKVKKDGSKILSLDRAYTNGFLKRGKNNRAVLFPVYPQLAALIDRIPKRDESLVFPSIAGGFINLNNFTRRYWSVVLKGLVADGELSQYLPTYHCRHTAATKMASSGVPLATIAALLDTSEDMLNRHYLDNDSLSENLSLDSLY